MVKISIGLAEGIRISLANWILKHDPKFLLRAGEIGKSIAESRKLKLDWSCYDKYAKTVSSIEENEDLLKNAREGISYGKFPDGVNGIEDPLGYVEFVRKRLARLKSKSKIYAKDLTQNIYKSVEETDVLDEDMRRNLRKMVGLMKEQERRLS